MSIEKKAFISAINGLEAATICQLPTKLSEFFRKKLPYKDLIETAEIVKKDFVRLAIRIMGNL